MPVSLEQFQNKKNLNFPYGLLLFHPLQKSRSTIAIGNPENMSISRLRTTKFVGLSLGFFVLVVLCALSANCFADESWKSQSELLKIVADQFEPPKDGKLLHRANRIWINKDEQVVVLDGYVVQRSVPLELFACPTGTKEHEAVVAVFAKSQLVHAGLLAIGAKAGSTASFEPFKPAHGTTIRAYVLWLDEEGKTKGTLAQNWIRKSGTKKAMSWDWVFAGSKIYKDEDDKEHYLGDSGELISVSNFSTSTMDVAVQSEQSNASLMFEAFTDRIPPRNTPVRLVLTLLDEPPYRETEDESTAEAKALAEPADPAIPKPKDANANDKLEKSEPKHLTAKVDDNILKLLVGKSLKSAEPKVAPSEPVKTPPTKPKK